ncbi:MAG TPA: Uma2 family endonuclease [Thermomicrobiales bacterium]|jgi:Uma2 family endonuclease
MVARTRLYTAEELAEMPGDEPWELWEGELRKVPAAGSEASALALWIGYLISFFVVPRDLGLVTGADGSFVLRRDPDVVLVPDVAFTSWENVPGGEAPRSYFPGRPDLAVEVGSPSDRRRDVEEKVRRYGDAGVPLVWWAYPDRRCVEVYRRGVLVATVYEGDVLDGEDVLSGFSLPVAELSRGARRRS